MEYLIVVQNATVALNQEKLYSPAVVSKFTSPGDLPTAAKGTGAGPLEALNDSFGYYLAANVTLLVDSTRNTSLYTGGLIPDLFFLPGRLQLQLEHLPQMRPQVVQPDRIRPQFHVRFPIPHIAGREHGQ